MGNDVRISWTNGPTTKQVEKITSKYQEGHFDGMIDLYEYDRNRPKTNGSAKYVFAERSIEDEGYKLMIKDLCSLNGVEFKEPYWDIKIGKDWNDGACHIVNRIMQDTSVPVGHKIIGLERTECACGLVEEFYKIKMIPY